LFTVGLLAAVASPRDAKALGYFTDNTLTTLPATQACQDTKAGCYTSWLTTADLDGDGDFDIIEANGGGYYAPGVAEESAVYINNGTGIFTDVTRPRSATPTIGTAKLRWRTSTAMVTWTSTNLAATASIWTSFGSRPPRGCSPIRPIHCFPVG